MRSPNFNVPVGISRHFPTEISLTLFERMCLVRYFELGIIDAIQTKDINYAVYLSSGQEAIAAALSMELRDYQIFPQHRAHDIFLTFGAPPERLKDELHGLPTGTSQGKAGSNCLQYHADGLNIYGHHGLIGENVPQGVGAALGNGRNTLCIFGDGAAEEDYVLSAMGFAATHRLPILFVCIDNNLSILTEVSARRSWNITDVARAFGLTAMDVADDPWAVLDVTRTASTRLPALINCHTCRGYWHAGTGIDGPPPWDRLELVKMELIQLGQESQMRHIEQNIQKSMEALWGRSLSLKPLKN